MKKQVFIIIGAVIVLILLAVWGYLFFFGTPNSANEVFSDLGLQGSEDTSVVELPPVVEEEPVVNMERPKLRQLTTKLVAGYREVSTSTTTPAHLYYVEMGTGHIFSIDLTSGEEVRISGTTVPKAYGADISPNGKYVAVSTLGNSKNLSLVLGTLGTSSDMTTSNFNKVVQDYSIDTDNNLLYSEVTDKGLTANAYNFVTAKTNNLFTIPFREASVDWGEKSDSVHYVYPKSTYALDGFLYNAKAGKTSRLPLSGLGFSAVGNDEFILYNIQSKQVTKSYIYDLEQKLSRPLDAVVVPEKCLVPATGMKFVCPFESKALPYEFPDEWYRGSLSFKDSLWLLDAETMTGELLVDTFEESGREIDIIKLTNSSNGGALYFINKNDNTLWMYEF